MVLNRIGHTCFVTLPPDCDAEVLVEVGRTVAESTHAHRDRRVVIDATAIAMLDPADASQLVALCRVVKLMGATPTIAGLRPEVVAALVSMDVDLGGVECVLDIAASVERV